MESHDLISRDIIPRQLALEFLTTLATTGERELSLSVDWLESAVIRLSLSDCARDLVEFAEKKGVAVAEPTSILEAFFSLEGLRSSLDWSGPALVKFLIDESAKEKLLPEGFNEETFKKTLERFFAQSEKLERTSKAQTIYDGTLPNFESCSSLVEFRPVFDDARERIVSGILTATLTIVSKSSNVKSGTEQLSFQLDATDADEIAEELTRIKKKLAALRRLTVRQTPLLNPSRSLYVEGD